MCFFLSKADDDIWLRHKEGYYKYIEKYVDDNAIVSKEPESIIQE